MVKWKLVFTSQAQRDAKKLVRSGLKEKAQHILDILERNPFTTLPSYEKIIGDLEGSYTRRINIHHRVVYQVLKEERTVKVLRLWTHYD